MDIEKLRDFFFYYVGINNFNIFFLSIRNVRIENILFIVDKVVIVISGVDDFISGRWSFVGGIINKIVVFFFRDILNNLIENVFFL